MTRALGVTHIYRNSPILRRMDAVTQYMVIQGALPEYFYRWRGASQLPSFSSLYPLPGHGRRPTRALLVPKVILPGPYRQLRGARACAIRILCASSPALCVSSSSPHGASVRIPFTAPIVCHNADCIHYEYVCVVFTSPKTELHVLFLSNTNPYL